MLKLGTRLNAVLQEINFVDAIADIGTDHGKIVVGAILCNRAKRAFAVDISEKCLSKARSLALEKGVEDRITFLTGDGLAPLSDKVNTVVVAGMGGLETIKILQSDNRAIAEKYIFVPHQDAYLLRKYLKENKFFIEKDYVIYDGKFYDIIVAVKGVNNYSEEELFLGKNYPQSEFYNLRNRFRIDRINNIMDNHSKSNSSKGLSDLLIKELEVLSNAESQSSN